MLGLPNEFAGRRDRSARFVRIEIVFRAGRRPGWRFAIADALLEQRIFMARRQTPVICRSSSSAPPLSSGSSSNLL